MGYIDATEITLILPAGVSIGASSTPFSFGEVDQLILEKSAELDAAAAAAGYTVPIAPPASGGPTQAYAQLQGLTKKGVGAVMLRTIFPNLPGAAGSKSTLADQYEKAWEDALKMIRKGELPLVGAGSDSGGSGRELPRSNYTADTSATIGITPHLNMDWQP